jgi:hypothetical protein
MERFFSQIKIPQQANQGSKDPSRLSAVDLIDNLANAKGGCFCHGSGFHVL